MTIWFLLVLAAILFFASLRYYNILLSLFASVAWLVLWRYNLTNPPSGIDQTGKEWLTYIFIGMAMVTMLIYFIRRYRIGQGAYRNGGRSFDSGIPEPPLSNNSSGLMDEGIDSYRARVRRALHSERR